VLKILVHLCTISRSKNGAFFSALLVLRACFMLLLLPGNSATAAAFLSVKNVAFFTEGSALCLMALKNNSFI
jgi:hypothetical protein